jgi:hypothetical protein
MAAHGVETAGAEVFFHPRARVAGAGPLEDRLTDAKAAIAQREQIDAADGDVAAEKIGSHSVAPCERGNHTQMLELNQSDLPMRLAAAGVVVVLEAGADADQRLFDWHDRLTATGAQADPLHPADLRQSVEVIVDRIHTRPASLATCIVT